MQQEYTAADYTMYSSSDVSFHLFLEDLDSLEILLPHLDLTKLKPKDIKRVLRDLPDTKLNLIIPHLDLTKLERQDIKQAIYDRTDSLALILPRLDLTKLESKDVTDMLNWVSHDQLEPLLRHLDLTKLKKTDIVPLLHRGGIMGHLILPYLDIRKLEDSEVYNALSLGRASSFTPPFISRNFHSNTLECAIAKDRGSCINDWLFNTTESKEEIINSAVELFWSYFGLATCEARNIYNSVTAIHNYVPNPVYSYCINDFSNNEILKEEGLSYFEFQIRITSYNFVPALTDQFKVPRIFHCVYLFAPGYTEEKRAELFDKHNPYMENNARVVQGWNQQYIWVNDLELVPTSVKVQGEKLNYTFKAVSELEEFSDRFANLVKAGKWHVSQKEFGLSTDIIRYLALYKYGGVYVDGDGILFTKLGLESLMQTHRAFVGQERHFDYRVGNAFIAAEAQSPLMKLVIDKIYENLFNIDDAPNYVKYPCSDTQRVLVTTGPVLLTVACAKQAVEDCAVLPYGFLYTTKGCPEGKQSQSHLLTYGPSPCADTSSLCKLVGKVADHDFASSWIGHDQSLSYSDVHCSPAT